MGKSKATRKKLTAAATTAATSDSDVSAELPVAPVPMKFARKSNVPSSSSEDDSDGGASEQPDNAAMTDVPAQETTVPPSGDNEESDNEENIDGNDDDINEEVDDDDDDDGEDDETAMETVALSSLPSRSLLDVRVDEAALEKKLSEIAIFASGGASTPLPFTESLTVTMDLTQPLSEDLAVEDLEREKRFAQLAAGAVHEGLDRLRAQKVKFRRPNDFFAEMVKTDAQMGKVKAQLLFNKERIEAAEKRRNNRDISKNKKKVRKEQLEKEQEKKRKTREEIEAFSRLRQERLQERAQGENDAPSDDDEFPIDLLDVEQLDDDNKFQKQKEIASGKKKAWRPTKEIDNREGGRGKGPKGPRGSGKGPDKAYDKGPGRGERSNFRAGKGGGVGSGGIKKKKGPKKRLGKNRRVVSKSKS